MRDFKRYDDIPKVLKIKVYEYFKSNEENTIPALSKIFNISPAQLSRIITEMQLEEKIQLKVIL